MPCKSFINKVPEILELLRFKNNSLIIDDVFLEKIAGQKHVDLLKNDIELTNQEIKDLQNILRQFTS